MAQLSRSEGSIDEGKLPECSGHPDVLACRPGPNADSSGKPRSRRDKAHAAPAIVGIECAQVREHRMLGDINAQRELGNLIGKPNELLACHRSGDIH